MEASKEFHDDSGRLIRIEDYSPEGQLQLIVTYAYDALGYNVERVVTHPDGKLLRRLAFEFNNEGREALYREYDSKNHLTHTSRFEYLTNNRRKVTTEFASGKIETREE